MALEQLSESQIALAYPSHDLTYLNDVWMSKNGVEVRKNLVENLKQRRNISEKLRVDPDFRVAILNECRESPLLFLNLFCWTYRPKYTCADGIVRGAAVKWEDRNGVWHETPAPDAPVITWPAQDAMVEEIHNTFKHGGMLLADKSREQGATVIIMSMMLWGMVFIDRFSALVISRKAGMVDSHAEDSLFGKVDYALSRLPESIVKPTAIQRIRGNEPLIQHLGMKSRIIGETSNKDVGQSLRTTVTFVDEAARYPDQRALMKSIRSVSAGYILASTPDGPGTEFSKLRARALSKEGGGHIRVVTLGYWDHPEMGQGRRIEQDIDGSITGRKGSHYWETNAFAVERAMNTNPRDIRENWLIDHDTSGMLVLNSNLLAKMRGVCKIPKHTGYFDLARSEFKKDHDGRLRLWCDLDKDGNPPFNDNYIIAIDPAQGVEKANTSIAVMSRMTGEIVAEIADPVISPEEAALLVAKLGKWFGGQHGYAFVIFERNGPGISFGHTLVRTGYPFVYYQRTEDKRTARKGRKWGWHSTLPSKEILFTQLNRFMANGWFVTYCIEGVEDMASWKFDEYGRMVAASMRDLTSGAMARHGDRAIAYGLCCIGVSEVARFNEAKPKAKPGTYAKLTEDLSLDFDEEPDDPFAIRK